MSSEDHVHHQPHRNRGFWTSRSVIALAVFLAVGALFLIYEHRVHLLTGNLFIAVLLAFCIGVHFLHRGADGTYDEEDKQ
jgi:hypothetical protein